MSAIAFDSYAAVKKLQEAGFTEQQAEAQTALLRDVIVGELATKRDEALKPDLKNVCAELKHDIKTLCAELKRGIKAFRTDIKHEMKKLELSLTIKFGVMLVFTVVAMVVLIKLL